MHLLFRSQFPDSKLSESDVIVSSYLSLLNLKKSVWRGRVLALLDIPAIRDRFNIALADPRANT